MFRCLGLILRLVAAAQQVCGAAAKFPERACPWGWKSQLPSCRQELKCALASSVHPCELAGALGAPHCWPGLHTEQSTSKMFIVTETQQEFIQTFSEQTDASQVHVTAKLLRPCCEHTST